MVLAILAAFSEAWDSHADSVNITHNSKHWWNGTCAKALAWYWSSWLQEDWAAFQHAMCTAKQGFFDHQIQEIFVKKA